MMRTEIAQHRGIARADAMIIRVLFQSCDRDKRRLLRMRKIVSDALAKIDAILDARSAPEEPNN